MRFLAVFLLSILSFSGLATTTRALSQTELDRLERQSTQDRERAITATKIYLSIPLSDRQRLQVSVFRCNALKELSRYDEVAKLFDTAKPLFPGHAEEALRITACYSSALQLQGRTRSALSLIDDMLQQYEADAEPYGVSFLLSTKASVHNYRGEFTEAMEALTLAMKLLETSGRINHYHQISMRDNLSNIYHYLGLTELAMEQTQLTLKEAQEYGDKRLESVATHNTAALYLKRGQYDKAKELAHQAQALSNEINDPVGAGYSSIIIASSLAEQGRYKEALAATENLELMFNRYKENVASANLQLKKSQWYSKLDDYHLALRYAQEAQRLFSVADTTLGLSKSAKALAEIHRKRGDIQLALAMQDRQIELSEQLFALEMNKEIARQQAEFQKSFERKEMQLLEAHLNAQQNAFRQTQAQYRVTLTIAACLFISVGALLLLLWRSNQLSQQLKHSAYHDSLTNLGNRRCALERLENEHQRFLRHKQPFCAALIDIDHFKMVNDKLGHQLGDEALISVANTLKASLRKIDCCARYGGEEFLVVFPNTRLDQAHEVVERLRQAIESIEIDNIGPLSISVGYGEFTEHEDLDALLRSIDYALYQAKAKGRNRCIKASSQLQSSHKKSEAVKPTSDLATDTTAVPN